MHKYLHSYLLAVDKCDATATTAHIYLYTVFTVDTMTVGAFRYGCTDYPYNPWASPYIQGQALRINDDS